MRIGFDIDGVLANFVAAYTPLVIDTTGVDLFQPVDWVDPPVYNWNAHRGYSLEEIKASYAVIATSEDFWANLKPLEGARTLAPMFDNLNHKHEIYFITSRKGINPRKQTEGWLAYHLSGTGDIPCALIVKNGMRGEVVKALQLDAYLDDYYENVTDCLRVAPTTRTYVLSRSYNDGSDIFRHPLAEERRVPDMNAFLRAENLLA